MLTKPAPRIFFIACAIAIVLAFSLFFVPDPVARWIQLVAFALPLLGAIVAALVRRKTRGSERSPH